MDTLDNPPTSIADELAALRAEKAHRDAIANHIPAMIGYWNRDLRCEFANDAYVEWFGLTPHKAIGLHMSELLGEPLFRRNEPYARKALAGEAQRFEREIRKPDGSLGYTDARYIPDVDASGNIRGFVVLVSDITELHRAYERTRDLAQRLESAREHERRSLARVLHEGIAQDLFAMNLGLDHLQAQLAGQAGLTEVCQEVTNGLTKCMAYVRQVANDLRPAGLEHMPLSLAIAQHARFVGELANLHTKVRELTPIPRIGEQSQLLLFRASQEALTNVARHAKASRVDITLSANARTVVLNVVDDGVGFADGALDKPGSLGLLGLRERVQMIGGTLDIKNEPGSGAALSIAIPVPESAEDAINGNDK